MLVIHAAVSVGGHDPAPTLLRHDGADALDKPIGNPFDLGYSGARFRAYLGQRPNCFSVNCLQRIGALLDRVSSQKSIGGLDAVSKPDGAAFRLMVYRM